MRTPKRALALALSLALVSAGFPTSSLAEALQPNTLEPAATELVTWLDSPEGVSATKADVRLFVRDAQGEWTDAEQPTTADKLAELLGEDTDATTGVRATLPDELAEDYSVWYRARTQDDAWLAWVCDGDDLVAENTEKPEGAQLLPLHDIQLLVSPKDAPAPAEDDAQAEDTTPAATTDADEPADVAAAETSDEAAPIATVQDEPAQSAEPAKDEQPAKDERADKSAQDNAAKADAAESAATESATAKVAATEESPAGSAQAAEPADQADSAEPTDPIASESSVPADPAPAATDPVLSAQALTEQAISWKRLGGANRYDTMALISQEAFITNTWAVVATGDNFPDALAAGALAGAKKCPIILTSSTTLSPQAVSELQRLGVRHVYLAGGTSAVSAEAEEGIKALGIETIRAAGGDRMATSLEIYNTVRKLGSKSDTVIVATGSNFPDSLSIGPYAYAKAAPIVLTNGNNVLTDGVVSAIKSDALVKRIVIVGGSSVVSDQVKDQLGGSYSYVRLGGSDRYDTSRLIADWEIGEGLTWDYPAIASGNKFPDALAGATLIGGKKSVILLADKADQATLGLLYSNRASVKSGYLLGGEATVTIADPITAYELHDLQLDGVDISGYNAPIDTASLEADFVIIKATEGYDGTVWNPTYTTMADDALASGKLIGFYHYANGENATTEAEEFYEAIKDYKGRAIACLDWEGRGNELFNTGIDPLWCKAFLDRLQELYGGTPFLYTNKNCTNKHDWSIVAESYPLWGAQYPDYEPVYGYQADPWQSAEKWGVWGSKPTIFQYTSSGRLEHDGGSAEEALDFDLFYGTRAHWDAYLS